MGNKYIFKNKTFIKIVNKYNKTKDVEGCLLNVLYFLSNDDDFLIDFFNERDFLNCYKNSKKITIKEIAELKRSKMYPVDKQFKWSENAETGFIRQDNFCYYVEKYIGIEYNVIIKKMYKLFYNDKVEIGNCWLYWGYKNRHCTRGMGYRLKK